MNSININQIETIIKSDYIELIQRRLSKNVGDIRHSREYILYKSNMQQIGHSNEILEEVKFSYIYNFCLKTISRLIGGLQLNVNDIYHYEEILTSFFDVFNTICTMWFGSEIDVEELNQEWTTLTSLFSHIHNMEFLNISLEYGKRYISPHLFACSFSIFFIHLSGFIRDFHNNYNQIKSNFQNDPEHLLKYFELFENYVNMDREALFQYFINEDVYLEIEEQEELPNEYIPPPQRQGNFLQLPLTIGECPICLDEETSAFICHNKHILACVNCSDKINTCPICRKSY